MSASPNWFRAALEVPVEIGAADVDGSSIAFRAWGEAGAPGVILVHGGAAHSRWWDHIAPLLIEGKRRVVALDLSGHGDSAHRAAYGLDVWATEVRAVGEAAAIAGPPVVIGHSMGGFVALWAAMTVGEELSGAVVVDSPIRELTPEERASREGAAFGPLRVFPALEDGVARFRPIPTQPVLDYIAAHIAGNSLRAVDGGWVWKFDRRLFGSSSLSPASLTPLQTRLALIRGERGILQRHMWDLLREQCGRDIALVEIPDAGHHIMLDQPLPLVAALRTFLAQWELPAAE